MKASMPHSRPKVAVRGVAQRTREITESLRSLEDAALRSESLLPGWSRLTVACHLRFGAEALLRMTRDALAGKETAYYPQGRERQRPATLEPRPAESPQDVVESLAHSSQNLDDVWRLVGDDAWETPVVEPAGNPVLGTLPLHRVTLMRWTEVEVHGTDLGLGLSDWSDDFVTAALPMRLAWLNTRRTNYRAVDESVQGAWLLEPTGNEAWLVRVDGTVVSSSPAIVGTTSDVTFSGSSRDLLALLLGRPTVVPLEVSGDPELAEAFPRAFPGP
jgi:maleylpyruvate isomerase